MCGSHVPGGEVRGAAGPAPKGRLQVLGEGCWGRAQSAHSWSLDPNSPAVKAATEATRPSSAEPGVEVTAGAESREGRA